MLQTRPQESQPPNPTQPKAMNPFSELSALRDLPHLQKIAARYYGALPSGIRRRIGFEEILSVCNYCWCEVVASTSRARHKAIRNWPAYLERVIPRKVANQLYKERSDFPEGKNSAWRATDCLSSAGGDEGAAPNEYLFNLVGESPYAVESVQSVDVEDFASTLPDTQKTILLDVVLYGETHMHTRAKLGISIQAYNDARACLDTSLTTYLEN